ncbi:MAG: hypothetical protein HY927_07740 [Elusimicrobia bacterium]|nr:hypothetical protein [Elusimicrobiota bacterium]
MKSSPGRKARLKKPAAVIRRATPEDADELRRMYHDVYEGKYTLSIIYDADETADALKKDDVHWFVAEDAGRIVSSVIFSVERDLKLAKVFGAVVLPEYRGSDLTERAIAMGLASIIDEEGQAHSAYATARTISPAPTRLLRNLGFADLGVLPNVRKVQNYETHCMCAYFRKGALADRVVPPRLPTALKPFYSIVRRATGIGDAEWHELPIEPSSPYAGKWIEFEIIEAPHYILGRWKALKAEHKLKMQFFPFHEPNLLLVAKDRPAEIYVYYSKSDHYAAIIGGHEHVPDLTHLLNSIVMALEEHGARYLELLTSAYHPEVVKRIMDARFLPSAYYPALRWNHGQGHDYIVFSKSFVLLDFSNIVAEGLVSDYMREYFNLWRALYIRGV